jgi:hypothetical protein
LSAECRAMSRVQHLSESDLERELLRKSVSLMDADRHRCCDCGRTPLVGEHRHFYGRGTVVCELCRALRADVPERTELVRGEGRGATVRVLRTAA